MNLKRKTKAMLSILVSATILASTTVASGVDMPVEEVAENVVYYGGGHTATKISHPTKGSGEADGIVDYAGNGNVEVNPEVGQGERGQSYSWSSLAYGDWVYIGTNYASMMSTVQLAGSKLDYAYDTEKLEAMLNSMFNGNFFINQEDGGDSKSILLKVNYKTCEVKILMSKADTGGAVNFRNAVEYKDKLYFCGAVAGLPSVYEIDPETDEYKMVYQGVTREENIEAYKLGLSVGVRGICVFDNKLTISCMGLEGAYIATAENPSEGQSAFTKIANMEDLFGYPAYRYCDSIYGGSIWDMIEFNDKLYVSICTGTPENMPDDNTMQSFALVVGEKTEDGGISWRALAGDQEKDGARYTFGIDPERTRSGAANLMVYNDYLYIGEYNDEEIALLDVGFKYDFDFMNANLEQSVNLYRMDKDENMELVVGDADTMFPEGSLSGIGSGFGRHENQYIWKMCVSNGKLYVGTFDTSSLMEPVGQFANGEIFKMSGAEWKSQINYLTTFLNMLKPENSAKTADFVEFSKVASETKNASKSAFVTNTLKSKLTAVSDSAYSLSDEQVLSIAEDVSDLDSTDVTVENIEDYEAYISELNALIAKFEEAVNNEDYANAEVYYQSIVDLYNKYMPIIQEKLQQLGAVAEFVANAIKSTYDWLLNESNQELVKDVLTSCKYLSTAKKGFDLYVTDDGVNFETITVDGFGDEYNHGFRTTAVTEDGIVVGTANPFYGTQVWLLSEDEAPSYVIGDADGNKEVDLTDLVMIKKSLLGTMELDEAQIMASDIDSDGEVSLID
ncbi:MAG: dockerin type I repeat-containing protein, partial [Acutalibacteraceae bacterium]|nr:dockerin type I repeat-containing protein [Acutalibacteraceae bacterium]